MSARYHVLVNQRAGSAADVQQLVSEAFTDNPHDVRIHDTGRNPLSAALRAARSPGCTVLVAAGGDGTVAAVAAAAIQEHKTLGVIPAGTLNHFAKDAGIPIDQAEAALLLRHGTVTALDYLELNGQPVLNNASLGVYPQMVRQREQRQHRFGKWPAMVMSLAGLLTQPLRRSTYQVTANGQAKQYRTAFIFIGNNNYHTEAGGIGGRESLTGGRLTLMIYRHNQWVDFGRQLWRAYRGMPSASSLHVSHPQTVTIDSRRRQLLVSHDGEISHFDSPIVATIIPGGLPVIGATSPKQPKGAQETSS